MTVAVVTGLYGGYGRLVDPPAQTLDARWVAVTDEEHDSEVWDVVVEPRSVRPRLAAKIPKCMPWNYADADTYVWIDASCRLRSAHALEDLVGWAAGSPVSQFVHPFRDCIYDEARASIAMPKYRGQPLQWQVDHYRSRGHPAHGGLWATGVIVYRPRAGVDVAGFTASWLAEQTAWSDQDQLSEPVVLAQRDITPWALPGNIFEACGWDHTGRRD